MEKVSPSAWRPCVRRGLNPSRSFHSQAVLLLPNNNISIVIGTNSWVLMAICPLGLSPVFTDATCWVVAGFVIYWERKKGSKIDQWTCFLVQSGKSRTLSGVCFSICFPYREINKLGIKLKSLSLNQYTAPPPPHITFWRSREGNLWPVGCMYTTWRLHVTGASVLIRSQDYPATPANTFTPKLSRIDDLQTKGNQWFIKLASKKSTREKTVKVQILM